MSQLLSVILPFFESFLEPHPPDKETVAPLLASPLDGQATGSNTRETCANMNPFPTSADATQPN